MTGAEYEIKQANEAELSVIGALLIKPDLFLKTAEIISVDDFHTEFHRIIYGTIADLFMSTGICDLVILLDRVTAKDQKRDRNQTKEYLMRASDNVVILEHTEHYCNIIKNRSIARKARKIAYDAYTAGFYNPDGRPHEDIQTLAEKLAGLTRDKRQRGSRKLNEILYDVHRDLFDNGEDLSLSTGFGNLDKLIDGIYPADLIVIGAQTGVGKTAFALQIMRNMARHGKKIMLYSQEMTDKQNALRLVARQSGVDLYKLKKYGRLDNTEIEKVSEALSELSELPIEIKDFGGITVDDIRLDRISKKDIDVIFIDHIGLMRVSKSDRKSKRYEEITQIAIELRSLALEIKRPIIVLSQFNRDSTRAKNEPDLSSFRDSGEIEQSATTAILLWQMPDYENDRVIGVKVAKNRQGASGNKIYMIFDAPRMNFIEIEGYRPPVKNNRITDKNEIDNIFGKKGG